MEKSNINSLVYKRKTLPTTTPSVSVSSDDKNEVKRIVDNFFSYILAKHS